MQIWMRVLIGTTLAMKMIISLYNCCIQVALLRETWRVEMRPAPRTNAATSRAPSPPVDGDDDDDVGTSLVVVILFLEKPRWSRPSHTVVGLVIRRWITARAIYGRVATCGHFAEFHHVVERHWTNPSWNHVVSACVRFYTRPHSRAWCRTATLNTHVSKRYNLSWWSLLINFYGWNDTVSLHAAGKNWWHLILNGNYIVKSY